MSSLAVEKLRAAFPALQESGDKKPFIYFDGPGGTQMAQQAIDGMLAYITGGMANLHGAFPTSVGTDNLLLEGRKAMADLLHCAPEEVAFGQNMTTLAFSIARSLGNFFSSGDEVVVTEMDHRANVDPWVTLAADKGAKVRFLELNTETYILNLDKLDELITEKTKLVAVGMSSNVTGTVTDVKRVIARAKEVNAIVVLDAVHAVPHLPIDFQELACDVLLCSAYKFFGPHIGIAVIAASLFEKLQVYKLAPAPQQIPDKLETGTQNHEAIAGLIGAITFIEKLGEGKTRRERLTSGMHRIEEHEQQLTARLDSFLRQVPGLILYRAPEGIYRTPTFAFTLPGIKAREVTSWFAEHYSMCIADGHFYASTMADKLGVNPMGGWVRIGLAPYNTLEEVALFEQGLREFIETKVSR
ncbi:cysteine desulfurase-like protein [Pontibacter virosus]|uniref:Cysteine desulfurase family protein (TIGR01976 family) n=1 Tax=Pontibacter virosus TaxID=1765052 RepID=A0A2U1AVG2_9BACT|nr:cysteine desulfurase-like protein [Pontibacter virosus]PVY40227.1 cysteine desulfurase family protein (TIGR01976 family) [Pontibacter virosus]